MCKQPRTGDDQLKTGPGPDSENVPFLKTIVIVQSIPVIMVKRVLVAYGIDVDAVSGWYFSPCQVPLGHGLIDFRINTKDSSPANPTDVSRGIFGATVGIDRLLKLWDRLGIKTTWFVPAHSIESFPSQIAKIRDAGHEM